MYDKMIEQNKFSEEEVIELKKTRKEIWNTFKKKMKKMHPGLSIELIKGAFKHHFSFDPE